MDEFKFVLKCFVFSAVLLVLTQIKSGETTVEGHIEAMLVNSKVAEFVNKSANGGVKMIKDGSAYIKNSYIKWRYSEPTSSANIVETKKEAHNQSDTESIEE